MSGGTFISPMPSQEQASEKLRDLERKIKEGFMLGKYPKDGEKEKLAYYIMHACKVSWKDAYDQARHVVHQGFVGRSMTDKKKMNREEVQDEDDLALS